MTTHPQRVLLVAPECAPFLKVGGLGDVVAGLSKALRLLGCDARIVVPLCRQINQAAIQIEPEGPACVHMGREIEHWIGVHRGLLDEHVPVWFVDYGDYFDRPGLYGDGSGEYRDNAYRFALLTKAALQICKDRQFFPEVMHLHDWPAALGAAFLKTWDRVDSPLSSCASVLTIHNIGHQGKYPADVYSYLGIGGEYFTGDVFEDFGWVNLLKAGIYFADAITTVSPTHLREITSPEGGHGLAPYLNRRADNLAGIINGVDCEAWNPERDLLLPARYSATDLSGKAVCKRMLQQYFGLEVRPDLPLFGMVSRLVLQKGIDLLMPTLPSALERMPMQFVVLGSGAPYYENYFRWLSARYPGRVGNYIGYSEELSHLIEAGSDFFLMPSLYEPCGLNQIYSMCYGTLPVVRATGGLQDTVLDYDPRHGTGTGFKFDAPSGPALLEALTRATATWNERPGHIASLRRQAMSQRFTWADSALRYLEVFRQAMRRRESWR